MDVDGVERHLVHEVHAHHHHAGDPEEDDVEAGDQHVGRVVALQLRRLVRPAQRRERPERGGEPGVEHVLVARQRHAPCRSARSACAERLGSRSPRRTPCRPARTTPGSGGPTRAGARCTRAGCCASSRNRSSPSSSARSWSRPSRTAAIAGLASVAGVHIPLLGQPRLDRRRRSGRHAAPGGCAARSCRAGPAPRASSTMRLARLEAVEAMSAMRLGRHVGASRKSALPSISILPNWSSTLIWRRSLRLPTSKSLKSCAGVIFTAPVPFSGSAYSSATIGIRRPTSGRLHHACRSRCL